MVFGRKPASSSRGLRVIEAWTTGHPSQHVVGESNYFADLKRIASRLGGGPAGEAITTAVLVAEPDNRYDRNAVAVTIDGKAVGYLPREDAVYYSPVLLRLAERGVAVSVAARVWWSEDYDNDWVASVRLDLGPPGLLVPVNAPPSRAAMQLPPGGAMQVTGEDQYLDVLAPLVVETGQVAVLATLHEVTERKARSAKHVLEVRIDDHPVGRLTAAMSEHLLAAVRQADRSGVVLYVRASVRGNALKAEVTIYPTKVADLPQAWVDELTSTAADTPSAATAAARKDATPTTSVRHQPTESGLAKFPPAGWYRNPTGPGLRWWDGSQWTDHTHDP